MVKKFLCKNKFMMPIIIVVILSISCFSGCVDQTNWAPCENDGIKLETYGPVGIFGKCYFVYDTQYHENWQDYAFKIKGERKTNVNHFLAYLYDLDIHAVYHYKPVFYAFNGHAASIEKEDYTFCPGGPYAVTGSATNIKQESATLSGELTLLKSSDSCQVWFEYWGRPLNKHRVTDKIEMTSPGSFSADINDLWPNATYAYRVVASNEIYTYYGELDQFITLSW